jgi:hypothetical protein
VNRVFSQRVPDASATFVAAGFEPVTYGHCFFEVALSCTTRKIVVAGIGGSGFFFPLLYHLSYSSLRRWQGSNLRPSVESKYPEPSPRHKLFKIFFLTSLPPYFFTSSSAHTHSVSFLCESCASENPGGISALTGSVRSAIGCCLVR